MKDSRQAATSDSTIRISADVDLLASEQNMCSYTSSRSEKYVLYVLVLCSLTAFRGANPQTTGVIIACWIS